MVGSSYFKTYHQSLKRVLFSEMLDAHLQSQQQRRLSIVGPCYTHEQWLAVQDQYKREQAAAVAGAAMTGAS